MVLSPSMNNLVIKVDDVKKSDGGILLPDNVSRMVLRGKVLAVGSEIKEVKDGDYVHFPSQVGYTITLGDASYRVINKEAVLAFESQ